MMRLVHWACALLALTNVVAALAVPWALLLRALDTDWRWSLLAATTTTIYLAGVIWPENRRKIIAATRFTGIPWASIAGAFARFGTSIAGRAKKTGGLAKRSGKTSNS